MPPGRLPVSLGAQAALYRSLLASRRVLVVLDNARDVDQVRPLLPDSPGCLVVVTSRNRLTGLITTEGAHPLTVDQLTDGEARELLVRRLGDARVSAEPDAVDRIVALCAGLPLALSVVAARAAAHPRFPPVALAEELRDAHDRLDAFDGGDLDTNVRAVFSWSYRQLDAEAARLFRLLGLHPGPDISVSAAASMFGVPPRRVRPVLGDLAGAHLVAEPAPGRFAAHDLLRAYSAELAHTLDPEPERHEAVRRVLDHCLHSAHAAAVLLSPAHGPVPWRPPVPGRLRPGATGARRRRPGSRPSTPCCSGSSSRPRTPATPPTRGSCPGR